MKYSQSYKDWKKKITNKSPIKKAKRKASIFGVLALLLSLISPEVSSAQIISEVPEVVHENIGTPSQNLSENISLLSEMNTSLEEENQNVPNLPVSIYAYKIVCQDESDLPNWGGSGTQASAPIVKIDENTAQNFVSASNGKCELISNWDFQYGFDSKDGEAGVHKLKGDHVGKANGVTTLGMCHEFFCGNNTFSGNEYNQWKDFDSNSSSSGFVPAKAEIMDLEGAPGVWVREVLKDNYVPFTQPQIIGAGSSLSAEIHCHTSIQGYDNYSSVANPLLGNSYYCVAFNALNESDENNENPLENIVLLVVQYF